MNSKSRRAIRWRDMPLHFKLLVPVTIVNCIITTILFFSVWTYSTAQLESRLVDDAILLSHTVRSSARSIPDAEELSTLLETIGIESRINFIAIADPQSVRVTFATDPITRDRPEVVIPFWHAFQARSRRANVTSPWFHFSKHQLQYVSPRFQGQDKAVAGDFVVLIAMDTSKARREVLSGARSFAAALLFCLLALGTTTVWGLRVIVVRRVNKIMKSLPKTPEDLLNPVQPLQGLDELSKLSRALCRAYSNLGHSFVQLDHHAKQLEATGEKARIGLWRLVIADTDLRHMTVLLSEQSYRLLGLETGLPVRVGMLLDRLMPEHSSQFEIALLEALETGDEIDLEISMSGADALCLHLVGSVYSNDGKVEAVDGTIQDISHQKQLAAKDLELGRLRLQLAASASVS